MGAPGAWASGVGRPESARLSADVATPPVAAAAAAAAAEDDDDDDDNDDVADDDDSVERNDTQRRTSLAESAPETTSNLHNICIHLGIDSQRSQKSLAFEWATVASHRESSSFFDGIIFNIDVAFYGTAIVF